MRYSAHNWATWERTRRSRQVCGFTGEIVMSGNDGISRVNATCKCARLVLLALAGLWIPAACVAQQTTATMLGTITDATGAAVPGVQVHASNPATAVKREAVSDQAGNYSFPYLPAGNYE